MGGFSPRRASRLALALALGGWLAGPGAADEPGEGPPPQAPPAASPTAQEETPASSRDTALTSRVLLKVVHPAEARAAIIAAAESQRGHAIFVTDVRVRLKVPPGGLGPVLEAIAAQGFVVERSLEREDRTQAIANLEGELRSKLEILERLQGLFPTADVKATLDIEKEMHRLVSEVESAKGRLRVERDRTAWAAVEVSLRFRARERVDDVRSPFGWLNTVDLDRLVDGF